MPMRIYSLVPRLSEKGEEEERTPPPHLIRACGGGYDITVQGDEQLLPHKGYM